MPTVRPVSVPKSVSDECTTLEFRVSPVSVPAAAVIVMPAVPSKLTPLMARGVCSAVAVAALPVVEPDEPVTEPFIGLVTVRLASVPTLVREELTTVAFRTVPVRVLASAVTVISPVPSKVTPLILRPVCKAVAVAALPVVEPEVPLTLPVTLPVRLPEKLAADRPLVNVGVGSLYLAT